MTDERLRSLERDAAASGTLEAEVRLLQVRLRQGDLDPAWLETGARLGHEGARRALGRFVPVLWSAGLRDLVRDLGAPAIVRALKAWADEAAPDEAAREPLAAVSAWLERPDDEARARCAGVARGASPSTLPGALTLAVHAAAHAAGRLEPSDLAAVWSEPPFGPNEGQARAIRHALAVWALSVKDGPTPPVWPAPAVASAALVAATREATARFEAALAAKPTRAEATALRRRLREKTLDRDMVEVAADLAHPAAWLVARREGAPDLAPPSSGREVAERLSAIVGARAARVRTKVRQRRHWVGEDGAERSAVGWRTALGDARWPEWGRRFVVRAALELGERALAGFEAARPDDPRPREALEAVRAWYASPARAPRTRARPVWPPCGPGRPRGRPATARLAAPPAWSPRRPASSRAPSAPGTPA